MNLTVLKSNLSQKRNIILLTIILIMLVVASVMSFLLMDKKNEKAEMVTFSSEDSSISINVSSEYDFNKIEDDSYLLALRSSITGTGIYCSKVSNNNVRDTLKLINADKDDYISKFSNISQVSEVTETNVNGLQAYTYNFHYKETIYVEVYWIVRDTDFIVIDFNVNTQNMDLTPHISEILNSLKFN